MKSNDKVNGSLPAKNTNQPTAKKLREQGAADFNAGKSINNFFHIPLKRHTEYLRAAYELGWRGAKADSPKAATKPSTTKPSSEVTIQGRNFVFGEAARKQIEAEGQKLRDKKERMRAKHLELEAKYQKAITAIKAAGIPIEEINPATVQQYVLEGQTPSTIVDLIRKEYDDEPVERKADGLKSDDPLLGKKVRPDLWKAPQLLQRDGWELVHDTLGVLKEGDPIADMNGHRAIVKGFRPPRNEGSTGRIVVEYVRAPEYAGTLSEFFPSVFDCSIRRIAAPAPAPAPKAVVGAEPILPSLLDVPTSIEGMKNLLAQFAEELAENNIRRITQKPPIRAAVLELAEYIVEQAVSDYRGKVRS